MTDALAGLVSEETASAETPAAQPPDIETLKAQWKQEAEAEFAKRAAGFQSALNEKDAALKKAQREAYELQMSGMTQDEKDALEWDNLQKERDALAQQVALFQLRGEYGDLVDLYQQMTQAPDAKAQLEFLKAKLTPTQAAASTQETPAEAEPEIPSVDLNNPANPGPDFGDGTVMFNGRPVDESWADRILKSARRMR